MTVHREGRRALSISFIMLIVISLGSSYLFPLPVTYTLSTICFVLFLIFLNFYRSPYRRFSGDMKNSVVAPADGKVVAIEEVFEPEYFKDTRLQVSIFMSPLNVHANWYPVNGEVTMSKHHNGYFKAAYLPKSSTENERSSVVIKRENGIEILVRQVAGAMARRIVTYPKPGTKAHIDKHFGFIKLGSRVDLYLPVGTPILVEMDQKVTGNQTVIAKMPIE